jgi:hypothetical protein
MFIKTRIKQKENGCGFACLSMITGDAIENIEKEIGYSKSIKIQDIINFLKNKDFNVDNLITGIGKSFKVPNRGLIFTRHIINNIIVHHCMILNGFKIINPNEPEKTFNINDLIDNHKIVGFIKINGT